MAKKEKEIEAEDEEVVEAELYYDQTVTINDNHGTINFYQTGTPPPPPKPPGGNG